MLKIESITLYGYGLMIALGVISAILVAYFRAKKHDLNQDMVLTLAIFALIFGFAGAKLLYVIVEFKSFINNPMLILSGSGFVVYGGIISGVLAVIIYCRIKKVNFFEYFDLLVPSVSIAQAFGRIGCFLAGCCYGCETDSFIGITFTNSSIAPNLVKLVPTQLISSASNFAIAIILILLARRNTKPGRVGLLFLILYSVFRFIIEFFRNDFRGTIWFMSTSQFISIIIFIVAIILFVMSTRASKEKENKSE